MWGGNYRRALVDGKVRHISIVGRYLTGVVFASMCLALLASMLLLKVLCTREQRKQSKDIMSAFSIQWY
jgi:hypothetical protein